MVAKLVLEVQVCMMEYECVWLEQLMGKMKVCSMDVIRVARLVDLLDQLSDEYWDEISVARKDYCKVVYLVAKME